MRSCLPLLACLPALAQLPEGLKPDFLKQPPKALMVAAADKARVIRLGDAEVLARCGRIYLAAGQRERALDAFRRVIEGDPRNPEAYVLVAEAWFKATIPSEGLAVLQRLPADGPRAAEALAKAALLLLDAGLEPEAKGFADRAMAAGPRRWETALGFGCALLKKGRADEARPWLERVLTLRPRDEAVWLAIAEACAEAK